MKPVLSSWPPKKRTLWFAPIAGGIFLLTFLIVAFATQNFFLAILIPPFLAIGGAFLLVGWPEIRRKDDKPLVEPHLRPYLFFVIAPLLTLILYPVLGIALTQLGLPLKWLAITSIILSLGLGIAIAYRLVGIPDLLGNARKQYESVPPDRRPYLFFPIVVTLFVAFYLTLGVVSTRLMGRMVSGDPTPLLNLQVIFLLPLSLALAGGLAWLLVGIPPILTRPAHHLPKVTGKHRPRAFFATFLVLGTLATLIIGALLTTYSPLPATLVLALGVVLGFALGAGLSTAIWGTPARWRRFDDYEPGIHPTLQLPIRIAAALLTGLAVAVSIGLADIDLFWGLLAGALTAGVALILLTGTHHRIAARKNEPTFVPDLPDRVKPLILIPAWFLISGTIFAVLTYLLPGIIPVNALIAVVIGLTTTFLLIEQPLLKDLIQGRRQERAKKKAWQARRTERLASANKDNAADKDADT